MYSALFGEVDKQCTQSSPQLMGILNATPDSFFDKGSFFSLEEGIKRGLEIAKEGADILDIGGESTRPGAQPVI